MAKPKLGSGARFAALKSKLATRPGVTNPGGLAAFIGRKKYGPKKFAALSAGGRKKVAAKGMHEVVTGPTTILAGERGPERVDITPLKPLSPAQTQRLATNDHALDRMMEKFRRG